MSFELTPEKLQNIAVGCVTAFMNKQASLSEAISKQAQALEMNPEQTKRVIEASNTIAYLRQLEKSADRTFEFEVADYGKVISSMCLPDPITKSAEEDKKDKDKKEEKEPNGDGKDSKDKKDDDKGKPDENGDEKYSYRSKEREDQEKRAMLSRQFFKAKNQLTKIAYDKVEVQLSLAKAVGELRAGTNSIEKLSHVVSPEDMDKTLALCGIEKVAFEDEVFKDKELRSAREVYGLYKKAVALVAEEALLIDFTKRAEQVLFHKTATVEKLAGLGGLIGDGIAGAASGIARATGWAAKNVAKGVVGTGVWAAKNTGKITGVGLTALGGVGLTHTNNVRDLN